MRADGGTALSKRIGFYEHLAVQNNFVLPETMINAPIEEGNRNRFPRGLDGRNPRLTTPSWAYQCLYSILYYQYNLAVATISS